MPARTCLDFLTRRAGARCPRREKEDEARKEQRHNIKELELAPLLFALSPNVTARQVVSFYNAKQLDVVVLCGVKGGKLPVKMIGFSAPLSLPGRILPGQWYRSSRNSDVSLVLRRKGGGSHPVLSLDPILSWGGLA